MNGMIWFGIIIAIVVIGVVMAIFLGKKLIKSEEGNINKVSGDTILSIKNEAESVDDIVKKIDEINEEKPITFDIRGRIE